MTWTVPPFCSICVPTEARHAPVEIRIANVWNRGDWTLHLDNERVGRGTSVTPSGSNAVAMRRDGDTLVIECPLSRGR